MTPNPATRPADQADIAGRPDEPTGEERPPLLNAGRYAWAAVGIVALLVVAGLAAGRLSLVIVPLVVALFPAALLEPVADFLKRVGLPAALASLATIVGSLLVLAGVVALLVPVVAAELPALAESFGEGVEQLLDQTPVDIGGADELLQQARDQLGQAGEHVGSALEAATTVFETVAGVLFGLVALFFYLKDGQRIAHGVRDLFPDRMQGPLSEMARRVWHTLGSYFRGQLLVALVDAVLIGLGLLILGIPLALPLAVLIFFGGLFPIVGAVVTGAVAVLVALADAGLGTALIVLGIVVAVQQLESNVLEPVVLSHATKLHPLMVIVAITAGAVTLGILGAFLAVPVAAGFARVVDYLRGRDGDDEDDDGPEREGGDEDSEDESAPVITASSS
ncbi:MAG TPA: AI-2E family transporter [Egibacteraceae bacterium]|nr:AI-2E family transporter [Egibacteraceae bacterium]